MHQALAVIAAIVATSLNVYGKGRSVQVWTANYNRTSESRWLDPSCGESIERTEIPEKVALTPSAMPSGYLIKEHVANTCWNTSYHFTRWSDWWRFESTTRGQAGYKNGTLITGSPPDHDPGLRPYLEIQDEYADGFHEYLGSDGITKSIMEIRSTTSVLRHSGANASKVPQGIKLVVKVWQSVWDDSSKKYIPGPPVPYSSVTVMGKTPNCNGEVYLQLGNNDYDITPQISSSSEWYFWQFVLARPTVDLDRTVSYHPSFSSPPAFTARLPFYLEPDNDGCVPDVYPNGEPNYDVQRPASHPFPTSTADLTKAYEI